MLAVFRSPTILTVAFAAAAWLVAQNDASRAMAEGRRYDVSMLAAALTQMPDLDTLAGSTIAADHRPLRPEGSSP